MKLRIVLMDAFRFDYLNPDLMPNLFRVLAADGYYTKLETLFGYSSARELYFDTSRSKRLRV